MIKRIAKKVIPLAVLASLLTLPVWASGGDVLPSVSVNVGGDSGGSDTVKLLLMITVMSLLPSILIMTTAFTRIVIVFSFARNALGLQQTPPNQVLVGLAIFLSLFVMWPVVEQINTDAYTPYSQGTITQKEAIDKAIVPLKTFMLKQTKNDDINLFLNLSGKPKPESVEQISQISMVVVIPAFITSELKRAFIIGFLIYLPFLIIDMVVASVLMSMGMMMVPPSMISLPFKIMLFVLVDGWGLLVKSLITSFN